MHLWSNILGIGGVILINTAYLLLNMGKLKADDWAFPLTNFVGASLIVFSLWVEWNLSAFLMEAGWAVISFYGFVKATRKPKKASGIN